MRRICYPVLLALLALGAGSEAAQRPPESATSAGGIWNRYAPKNERKNVIQSKMTQLAGFGGAMKINNVVTATWVTGTAARWLVSEEADEKKLGPDVVEAHYRILRPDGGYLFLVNLRYADPFEGRKTRSALNLFESGQTSLQRKGDPETFSRASQELEMNRDTLPSSAKFENAYYIVMPRTTEDGRPIVRDLGDKVEFRFMIEGKRITLEFAIKDLVASLGDL